ncbi:DUF5374 domain-containing protein [Pasteurellaceae bacterium HPA106]|uniref:DUF5374 domain-containing protein n=1 Tax=Spirabiliibacterium pneumoniae TaxID=221400 RepID=UPI001AACF472|nr:DUF5374 domain-containing protein [Spirabiliibacterium pneumoniae]MBE2896299.1 DUF5374 domain-containing protein [Spirabiliibacterium pneumoniae]
MISMHFKTGGSVMGVLLALVMFSALIMTFQHWQQAQHRQSAVIFQRQQALLIAHNQTVRLRLNLGCEHTLRLNGVTFNIRCQASGVQVHYPLGRVALDMSSQ